jgi:hypothetical protein
LSSYSIWLLVGRDAARGPAPAPRLGEERNLRPQSSSAQNPPAVTTPPADKSVGRVTDVNLGKL